MTTFNTTIPKGTQVLAIVFQADPTPPEEVWNATGSRNSRQWDIRGGGGLTGEVPSNVIQFVELESDPLFFLFSFFAPSQAYSDTLAFSEYDDLWIQAIVLAIIKGNQNRVETLRGISKSVGAHSSDLFCWEQLSRFPGAFLASGEAWRGEGEEAGSFRVGEKRGSRRGIWSRFAAFASCGPAGKTQLALQST